MANYVDFERDFISRTIKLIDQYSEFIVGIQFDRQFNHTLMLNCLLGLIVMPKERVISYVPATRLTTEHKVRMGLVESELPDARMTLRSLIKKMRHSIAHFDIEVKSDDEEHLVDYILFKDEGIQQPYATFRASEVGNFLRFYADALINNLDRHR